MVTLQSADSALKSFYLDAVKEALDLKVNPLLAQFERTSVNVVGKDVRKSIRQGVSGGVGAGSETGDLPKSSAAPRLQFVSTLKNLYGTIEISDKALRAAATNEGAFVNVLNDEMQALIQNAKFNFGRMLYGDGSGMLSKVIEHIDERRMVVENIAPFVEGMVVDVYDAAGNIYENVSGRKIVEVDKIEGTITLEGENTDGVVEGGAYIYLQGSKGYELTGLDAVFGNSAIYGINRNASMLLKAKTRANVGQITEEILQTEIDGVEELTGAKINFIVCSWGVKRALVNHFREKGILLPTIEVAGGYKAIDFNGIPVVVDRFCPKGTMYLLNTDDFKIHQLCDWKWLEGEDGKILKQVPGKPVYTATLVKYAELMCERPNAQVRLKGIVEE